MVNPIRIDNRRNTSIPKFKPPQFNAPKKKNHHSRKRQIAKALSKVSQEVAETYGYPLEDFTTYLKSWKGKVLHEVEEEDGVPITYYLTFSSPQWTWDNLCGREGIYTIDAKTLKAIDFEMTIIN